MGQDCRQGNGINKQVEKTAESRERLGITKLDERTLKNGGVGGGGGGAQWSEGRYKKKLK